MPKKPNIVFVFGDEWRMQATGFNGDPNCETPVLDALAAESINVTHAVAGAPVCCPYRASLLTGQYPLTHGVYINDVELDPNCMSIARAARGVIEPGKEITEAILNCVEMAFRAYDPCFSCATHSLPGQMPLQVDILDSGHHLLRTFTR